MRLTKLQQYKINYYIQNKDKIKQQQKKYKEENKDKLKQYRENNKDKRRQQCKDYYKSNKDKLKQQCKDYYKDNKDKRRQHHLNIKYGISIENYNQLFNKQKGCCAICNKHQSELKARLCVDHDHKTGKVRGLCCGSCNLMLGYAKDNAENLTNGAEYLNNYNNAL